MISLSRNLRTKQRPSIKLTSAVYHYPKAMQHGWRPPSWKSLTSKLCRRWSDSKRELVGRRRIACRWQL